MSVPLLCKLSKVENIRMPLDLQLHRIHNLLRLLNNPHYKPKYIHVAGTNGKGSVCSYISHILTQAGIQNGRFNSPHLITPRDSIQINDIPVSQSVYERCKQLIHDTDKKHGVGCTEFELLTCTAFQIFADSEVEIAIMEVGVGGKLDATNVIPQEKTLVVGVTKIALDHQGLLGNTLAEIASQKVGIFKKNVPAVIDGSNDNSVVLVAEQEAMTVHCPLFVTKKSDCWMKPKLLGDYQYDNLAVALKMVSLMKDYNIKNNVIESGVQNMTWPGRLQQYTLFHNKIGLPNMESTLLLLDGAHNAGAAIELGKYLSAIRDVNGFIFVIAITKGKELSALFKPIITKDDTVIFTEFGPDIEGMPWIAPFPAAELEIQIRQQGIEFADIIVKPHVQDALAESILIANRDNKKIVVCGSLYLIADVLRL